MSMIQAGKRAGGQAEDRGLVANVGPLAVDVPRSVGYFGAIGLAVAFEVIEWPVGLFIASIPFIKMLNRPKLPEPVRFVEHVLDGAAKPVGGDSEGTVRVAGQQPADQPPSTPEQNGQRSASPSRTRRTGRAVAASRRSRPQARRRSTR
jgi:hypothetical protein